MAAPTATTNYTPDLVIDVTGTNVDSGNNDYVVTYRTGKLSKGFSIITGTLTAMTVTVLAANIHGTAIDITNDLFGTTAAPVTALASNSAYVADINIPVAEIVVRAARTNATNAVNFTVFGAKG